MLRGQITQIGLFVCCLFSALAWSSHPEMNPDQAERLEYLEAFNNAPEYLDASIDRETARRQLARQCADVDDCIDYVAGNLEDVRVAIPDNSEYWNKFWMVLRYPPATEAWSEMLEMTRVFQANREWPLLLIAQADVMSTSKAVELFSHTRNWVEAATSFADMMNGLALYTETLNVMPYFLAHAGERDLAEARRGLDEPFATSIRAAAEGEIAFFEHAVRTAPADVDVRFELGGKPEDYVRELRLVASNVARESEMTVAGYWGSAHEAVAEPLYTNVTRMQFGNYVNMMHVTRLRLYLLRALAGVYAGGEGLTGPLAPPPPLWQWQLESDPEQLCLIPAAVHPDRLDKPSEKFCAPYFGVSPLTGVIAAKSQASSGPCR